MVLKVVGAMPEFSIFPVAEPTAREAVCIERARSLVLWQEDHGWLCQWFVVSWLLSWWTLRGLGEKQRRYTFMVALAFADMRSRGKAIGERAGWVERLWRRVRDGLWVLVVATALGAVGCGDAMLERWTVNYACAGSSAVASVTVQATAAVWAQAAAVAQVERVCGIGRFAYTIGAAEVQAASDVSLPAERVQR